MSIGAALASVSVEPLEITEIIEKIENVRESDDIVTGEPLLPTRKSITSLFGATAQPTSVLRT